MMKQTTLHNSPSRHILITGSPGVGKTTLIKSLFENITKRNDDLITGGFYTKEVRDDFRQRIGFDLVSLSSPNTSTVPLSRVPNLFPAELEQRSSPPRVGKYLVDIPAFEKFMQPELSLHEGLSSASSSTERKSIYFIDEIGKMELFSKRFQNAVWELLNNTRVIVVATVPKKYSPKSFVSSVREREDIEEIFEITKANRDDMRDNIEKKLKSLVT